MPAATADVLGWADVVVRVNRSADGEATILDVGRLQATDLPDPQTGLGGEQHRNP